MFDIGQVEHHSGVANRLLFALVPRKGMTEWHFHNYWRHQHGTIVQPYETATFNMRKYTQLHKLDTSESYGLERFGKGQKYYGVASAWWSSYDALHAALSTKEAEEAMAVFIEDEYNFLDLPVMYGIFGKEHVIF